LWNSPARTAEEFAAMDRILNDQCSAIGRNPHDIIRQRQLFVSGNDAVGARRQLVEMIRAGCTQLILAPIPPRHANPVAWLAKEVVEPVLAEVSAAG
jgi:hypothetical protein